MGFGDVVPSELICLFIFSSPYAYLDSNASAKKNNDNVNTAITRKYHSMSVTGIESYMH